MSERRSRPGPSLDQRRARHALQSLEQVLEKLPCQNHRILYRSYVDRLGPTVLMNGLGQALASELAAANRAQEQKSPHRLLAEQVASWLCDPDDGVLPQKAGQDVAMKVLEQLCAACQVTYVRAEAEALAWLAWHKRFARARIEANDGGPEG